VGGARGLARSIANNDVVVLIVLELLTANDAVETMAGTDTVLAMILEVLGEGSEIAGVSGNLAVILRAKINNNSNKRENGSE
jgi:hypothetical protein